MKERVCGRVNIFPQLSVIHICQPLDTQLNWTSFSKMPRKESLRIEQTPHVRRLAVREVFERLTPKEKLYAHHMAR